MNLYTLQNEVGKWSAENFENKKNHQPLLGIAEEVGELCHAHLKLEQGIRGTKKEHMEAKEDAVGDIVIYLADYCTHNDIVLAKAVEDTWNKVKQRNWTTNKVDGSTVLH
jgi:NTP pyrophosphatase (non-canonical NTP hydrolase)